MDDFGNIIYVLAAIGWFFWNTYRKSQKAQEAAGNKTKPQVKPRTANAEPKPVEETRSLEDIIMEQLGQRKEEPKPVPVEVKKPSRREKFLNLDLTHSHLSDDYEMSRSEMQGHRVERQVRVLKTGDEDDSETLMQRLMPEGFDLRQAVVMEAVLNRPYK